MCKNIRTLHLRPPATERRGPRVRLAIRPQDQQGASKPSRANAEAFDRAVAESRCRHHALAGRTDDVRAAQEPRVEAAKRQARAAARTP